MQLLTTVLQYLITTLRNISCWCYILSNYTVENLGLRPDPALVIIYARKNATITTNRPKTMLGMNLANYCFLVQIHFTNSTNLAKRRSPFHNFDLVDLLTDYSIYLFSLG